MTEVENLRSTPEFTARMLEILSDPTMQKALAALKAAGEEEDVMEGADALASVRVLARQRGRSSIISELFALSVPLDLSEKPPLPSFGTDLSQEELAEAYSTAT